MGRRTGKTSMDFEHTKGPLKGKARKGSMRWMAIR